MPIKFAVENRDDLRLVVYRYSGHIHPKDVLDSLTRAVSQLAPNQPYHELLIFEHDSDLSDFDSASLARLYQDSSELYRKRNLGPRTAAAMLDASMDAKIIMPLFNALSLKGGGVALGFELFTEVEPALRWLGIPIDKGMEIVARAA